MFTVLPIHSQVSDSQGLTMRTDGIMAIVLIAPVSSAYIATRPLGCRCGSIRMGTWIEGGSSSTTVDVPASFAFGIISNYERWPQWSPWLSRVETFDADADGATSRWHLKFRAINVNWNSKCTLEDLDQNKVQWESTSGVLNSGSLEAIAGDGDPSSCTVTVSLRYQIPPLLEKLLSTRFISNLVSRRLKADLGRFRALAEAEHLAR